MATLAGNTIASTYPLLLKIDSSGIDATLRAVEDGDATDSALLLATNKVEVKPGSNDANAFEVSQADGTAVFTINTSSPGLSLAGNATITTADNSDTLTLVSTDDDTNQGPVLVMNRNPAGAANNDYLGEINFQGENTAGTPEAIDYVKFQSQATNVADGSEEGKFFLHSMVGGSLVQRITVAGGETVFNEDSSNDIDFRVEGATNANLLFVDGSADRVGIGTASPTDKFQINYDADFYEVFDGGGTWTTKRGNGSTGGKRIVTDLSSGSWGTDGGYIEFKPRNSTAMTIAGDGNVGIGSTSVTDITTVWATGTVLDVHESSGSDTGAIILSGDTTTNGGGVGSLVWANRNNSGQASEEAGAEGKGIGIIVTNVVTSDSNSGDDSGGDMKFFTKPEAGTIAERMRITSAGKVGIGETGPSTSFHLKGAGVSNCGIALFQTTQTSADNHELLTFYDGGGALCGEVYVHATNHTTVFSTSSDYRLKENETAISDGLTRLNQLKPYKFNFKSNVDKTKVDGFFAHEVSSIVPEAVVGEKDAVDDDGEIKKQMIDHSKLVPLLVAAVQELSAKVEALENA